MLGSVLRPRQAGAQQAQQEVAEGPTHSTQPVVGLRFRPHAAAGQQLLVLRRECLECWQVEGGGRGRLLRSEQVAQVGREHSLTAAWVVWQQLLVLRGGCRQYIGHGLFARLEFFVLGHGSMHGTAIGVTAQCADLAEAAAAHPRRHLHSAALWLQELEAAVGQGPISLLGLASMPHPAQPTPLPAAALLASCPGGLFLASLAADGWGVEGCHLVGEAPAGKAPALRAAVAASGGACYALLWEEGGAAMRLDLGSGEPGSCCCGCCCACSAGTSTGPG